MANIVFADPFGSYIKGQQEGTQNAIATGKAAREFRSDDLQHEFLKWYMPHKQAEVEMKQQQEQLATNRANLQMLASMSMSGDPRAQKMFADFVAEATGGNVKLDFTKNTPEQSAWIMGLMSGQIPAALLNRDVFSASGVQRYGFGLLGNTPNITGGPETAQEYPVFTANGDWMNGGATPQNFGNVQSGAATQYGTPAPTIQPRKDIFGTPAITPLPEQPTAKVQPLNSGAFETYGGGGMIEHSSPGYPAAINVTAPTQMPTMTVRPPVNEPTVAPSIWHDEVEQERVRGPVKQAATL